MHLCHHARLVRTLVICAGGLAAVGGAGTPAAADILVAWGYDVYGELGDGEATATPSTTPTPVLNLNRMAHGGRGPLGNAICEGQTAAIQDGAIYRWGMIRLGNDENDEPVYGADPIPDVVPGLESGFTLLGPQSFRVRNGVLYSFGQPVPGAPADITALSFSSFYGTTLALRNGVAWSWGSNSNSMLGDGSTVNSRATPAPIPTLQGGVTAVSAGDWHCAAIKDGVLYTWGSNYMGSLGLGLSTGGPSYPVVTTPTPVAVLGDGVTAVFAGRHFTLAVRNGFVYSWGWDLAGELGYTGGPTNSPRQVPGLHDIVDVSAFDAWCVALRADGTVWFWGGGLVTPREMLAPAGYKFTGVKMGSGFTLATIAPACPADFGSAGGAFKPDGRLDNNDFVAFISAFFAQDPLADCGSAGAMPTHDGAFDNNDFIVFITQFFGGC